MIFNTDWSYLVTLSDLIYEKEDQCVGGWDNVWVGWVSFGKIG